MFRLKPTLLQKRRFPDVFFFIAGLPLYARSRNIVAFPLILISIGFTRRRFIARFPPRRIGIAGFPTISRRSIIVRFPLRRIGIAGFPTISGRSNIVGFVLSLKGSGDRTWYATFSAGWFFHFGYNYRSDQRGS